MNPMLLAQLGLGGTGQPDPRQVVMTDRDLHAHAVALWDELGELINAARAIRPGRGRARDDRANSSSWRMKRDGTGGVADPERAAARAGRVARPAQFGRVGALAGGFETQWGDASVVRTLER